MRYEAGQPLPEKRLHPLSWVFQLVGSLGAVVPIGAAVALGAERSGLIWVALPLLLLGPLGALWHQWVYRYDFADDGLVIRDGLIFRNLRQIDYRRIENIDTQRNLLHRLLGVADVKVETSSGGGAEATIRVLSLDDARALSDTVFARRDALKGATPEDQQGAAPAESGTPLLALPPGELVMLGLIDNRNLLWVGAVLGALMQVVNVETLQRLLGPVLRDAGVAWLDQLGLVVAVLLALGTLVAVLAVGKILSVVAALVKYYGYRLDEQGSDLRVRHGLFTRVSVTLRVPRIQAVHQVATPLHRLFRRVALQADQAGGGGDPEAGQGGARPLAPICTPAQAEALIARALPGMTEHVPQWQSLSSRTRHRLARLWLWCWTALTLPPGLWWLGMHGLWLPLVGVPLALLHGHLYAKYTRWALTPDLLLFHRGWLWRRLAVVPRNRIQAIRLTRSPFDRRYRMSELEVDTAGGGLGKRRVRLPYLDRRVAARLGALLYH